MTDWYKIRNSFENKHNSSELSVETSCEMSDPYHIFTDNLSPIPASMVPRKLDFTVDDDDGLRDAAPTPASQSPPYRRVRALRLFDSPHTPKTLIEKCSTPSYHQSRSRLLRPAKLNPQTEGMPAGSSHHLHPPSYDDDSALGSLPPDECDESRAAPRRPVANINPFTPDGQALNKKKRAYSKTSYWDGTPPPEQPLKKLKESNIFRYYEEFVEIEEIGRGQFGRVIKCRNKLDGCVYALKRSIKPVAGSAAERAALREVHAHAALGKHANVVRYYSAWAENDHMIIQNEYCDGGSLQQRIEEGPLPETELLLVLQHIADGLAYIHSQQLVHMDVKPANIFVCSGAPSDAHDADDGYADEQHNNNNNNATHVYKIGDLGHVTVVTSPTVEEGDCRYLPVEVLQDNYTHLTKADIFSLGMSLFEAAGGGPLPKNGPLWQQYRDGKLPDLPDYSREFNQLLKQMVHPEPSSRPSAAAILRHQLLRPADAADTAILQMRQELADVKLQNMILSKKLQEAHRYIKSVTPNKHPSHLTLESVKYRTRSAKRHQKTKAPDTLTVPSPSKFNRNDRRTTRI